MTELMVSPYAWTLLCWVVYISIEEKVIIGVEYGLSHICAKPLEVKIYSNGDTALLCNQLIMD